MINDTYKIVRILNDMEIVINGGHEHGLKEGELLEIFVIGEEIKDPETSESLGTLDIIKGKVEIKTLYPKMSLCESAEFKVVKEKGPLYGIAQQMSIYGTTEVEKQVPLNVDLKQAQKVKEIDMAIKLGDMVRPTL